MLKFELNVEERKTLAKRMEELTGHPSLLHQGASVCV